MHFDETEHNIPGIIIGRKNLIQYRSLIFNLCTGYFESVFVISEIYSYISQFNWTTFCLIDDLKCDAGSFVYCRWQKWPTRLLRIYLLSPFLSWTFSSYEYIARVNTQLTAIVRRQYFIRCFTSISGGNTIIAIAAIRVLSLWQKSK
jgi:type III secretory pathway component EscU